MGGEGVGQGKRGLKREREGQRLKSHAYHSKLRLYHNNKEERVLKQFFILEKCVVEKSRFKEKKMRHQKGPAAIYYTMMSWGAEEPKQSIDENSQEGEKGNGEKKRSNEIFNSRKDPRMERKAAFWKSEKRAGEKKEGTLKNGSVGGGAGAPNTLLGMGERGEKKWTFDLEGR